MLLTKPLCYEVWVLVPQSAFVNMTLADTSSRTPVTNTTNRSAANTSAPNVSTANSSGTTGASTSAASYTSVTVNLSAWCLRSCRWVTASNTSGANSTVKNSSGANSTVNQSKSPSSQPRNYTNGSGGASASPSASAPPAAASEWVGYDPSGLADPETSRMCSALCGAAAGRYDR